MLVGEDTDELELKKRARRRLIGAIVLVLLVVTLVPLLLDNEPRKISEDVEINIISTSRSVSSTGVKDLGQNSVPDLEGRPIDLANSVPSAVVGANSKNSSSSQVNDEADSQYVIQLGAFSKNIGAQSLAKKLEENGFSVILEGVKGSNGSMTRVSVGVFSSRDQAQRTLERLESGKLTYGDAKITRTQP